jgi:hypothetical protein
MERGDPDVTVSITTFAIWSEGVQPEPVTSALHEPRSNSPDAVAHEFISFDREE